MRNAYPAAVHPESRVPGAWPLLTFTELAAHPGTVRQARIHARHALAEWGLAVLCDDAELLVSELVTNAVAASAASQAAIRMWLASGSRQVAVIVWDANPVPPRAAAPDPRAENGRGLLLVDAISDRWGWHAAGDGAGKFVWAVIQIPPEATCNMLS